MKRQLESSKLREMRERSVLPVGVNQEEERLGPADKQKAPKTSCCPGKASAGFPAPRWADGDQGAAPEAQRAPCVCVRVYTSFI